MVDLMVCTGMDLFVNFLLLFCSYLDGVIHRNGLFRLALNEWFLYAVERKCGDPKVTLHRTLGGHIHV